MDRKLIDWDSVIKVGHKIRIREFDDMEKQYGYRYVGDAKVINVFMSFTEDMKKICGDVINIDEEIEKTYEKRIEKPLLNNVDNQINNLKKIQKDLSSTYKKINELYMRI